MCSQLFPSVRVPVVCNHIFGLRGAAVSSCHLAAPRTICPLCRTSCWHGWGMCTHSQINQTLPAPWRRADLGGCQYRGSSSARNPAARSNFHLWLHNTLNLPYCDSKFSNARFSIGNIRDSLCYLYSIDVWNCVLCFPINSLDVLVPAMALVLRSTLYSRHYSLSRGDPEARNSQKRLRWRGERGRMGPWAHFYLLTAWSCAVQMRNFTDIKQTIHTKALITLFLAIAWNKKKEL